MRGLIFGAALATLTVPAFANCPPGAICPPSNPFVQGPAIYDQNGGYHGRLSNNPYMPDSTANPYGPYGNQYSPQNLNNPQTQQRLYGR